MATDKMQVNVYLEKKIVRQLDAVRKDDGLSRSAMVGRIIRRYLRKRDRKLELAASHASRRIVPPVVVK